MELQTVSDVREFFRDALQAALDHQHLHVQAHTEHYTLGTVVLFLLFVAGEHLEPRVHRALHGRVKAFVSGR